MKNPDVVDRLVSEDAVHNAIDRFNAHELDGIVLQVDRPIPRNRERSNSNFSQRGGYGGGYNNRNTYYTPRTFDEFRPREENKFRRPSIRQYPFNNGPANPTSVDTPADAEASRGLGPYYPEVVQDQVPLADIPKPLSSIENLPPRLNIKTDVEDSSSGRTIKKENSPIKQ